MIILDFGSGNTCKNDKGYIKRMIDELHKVDPKRKCVIKWQLFKECGGNTPLTQESFDYAYNYAKKEYDRKTTASVFDKESLDFLLTYKVPFIKIANRKELYWLAMYIKDLALISNDDIELVKKLDLMYCVSKYPAKLEDYPENIDVISDHTTNWDLYKRNKPIIHECHYALEDSTGLDVECGICRTPKQLKEIL